MVERSALLMLILLEEMKKIKCLCIQTSGEYKVFNIYSTDWIYVLLIKNIPVQL